MTIRYHDGQPDAATVRDVLSYNPETGIFVWKKPPVYHPRLRGTVAGSISTGYVLIKINGKKYKAHRLAWLYVHGEWPTQFIDHADGNPYNNAIANLRLATRSQNLHNSKRRVGRALPKGVRANGKNFTARIHIKGHLTTLGTFPTVSEAAQAYANAAYLHFGQFARPA